MAASFADHLFLVDPTNPDSARPYQGLHSVSPILIGLAAPFVALLMLAPRSFIHLGFVGPAMLLVILLAALVIFLHGVFTAGRVAGLNFDPAKRTVDVIETGLFSRRVTTLRFAEVAGLRAIRHFDRDGYEYVTTELVLASGERVVVPMQPSDAEMASVRSMLARR